MATLHRYRVSPTARSAVSGGHAVILDARLGRCFALNPVGVLIWAALNDGVALDTLERELQDKFAAVPAADIASDVKGFVDQLLERGLVIRE